jgi:hypothetical protein
MADPEDIKRWHALVACVYELGADAERLRPPAAPDGTQPLTAAYLEAFSAYGEAIKVAEAARPASADQLVSEATEGAAVLQGSKPPSSDALQ